MVDKKMQFVNVKVNVNVGGGYQEKLAETEIQESIPIVLGPEGVPTGLRDIRKGIRPAADGVLAELWAAFMERHTEAFRAQAEANAAEDPEDVKDEWAHYSARIDVGALLTTPGDSYSNPAITLMRHDAHEGGTLRKVPLTFSSADLSEFADTAIDLAIGLVESTFGRRTDVAIALGNCEECDGPVVPYEDGFRCDTCHCGAKVQVVRRGDAD